MADKPTQIIITLNENGTVKVDWTHVNELLFYGMVEGAKVAYQDTMRLKKGEAITVTPERPLTDDERREALDRAVLLHQQETAALLRQGQPPAKRGVSRERQSGGDLSEYPKRVVSEIIRYQCGHEEHAHVTEDRAATCVAAQKRAVKAMGKSEVRSARNQRIGLARLAGATYAAIAKEEGLSCERVRLIAGEYEAAHRRAIIKAEREHLHLSREARATMDLYFGHMTRQEVRQLITGVCEWPWTGTLEDMTGAQEIREWALTAPVPAADLTKEEER